MSIRVHFSIVIIQFQIQFINLQKNPDILTIVRVNDNTVSNGANTVISRHVAQLVAQLAGYTTALLTLNGRGTVLFLFLKCAHM